MPLHILIGAGGTVTIGPRAWPLKASTDEITLFSSVLDATEIELFDIEQSAGPHRRTTVGELRAWLAERATVVAAHDASAQEPRTYTEVPDIPSAPTAPEGQELI